MNKRRVALASIVIAFSILAFVFSAWMKPFSAVPLNEQISHSEQLLCDVLTSSSVFLSEEVKPKVTGFDTSNVSTFVIALRLLQPKSVAAHEYRAPAPGEYPRPLWLLHRSLLI